MTDLWIFGYGSLMWKPGFEAAETVHARLTGYRRCFCLQSVHHRGTPMRPGLVLGLDRGGSCEGLAFRIPARQARATLAYLRAREQVDGVYREASLAVELRGERRGQLAIAYLVEHAHPSYVGNLPVARQAQVIRGAAGKSGTNVDYLVNTLEHLTLIGIKERELERVLITMGPLLACGDAVRREARASSLVPLAARQPIELRRLRPGDRRRFMYR
jgi:glutathione-specific gamma-glutamylcyclotransferase